MLKHLPEGLVPFEDCGFARHPFAPLAMEPVRVDCRVDAEDGRPVLRLRVDGGPESEIAPESTDGRHYHFGLGGFALGLPHTATYFGQLFFSCGPMWYLLSLMIAWILLDLILNIFPEQYINWAVLGTMLLGWGICITWEAPFCIGQGMVTVPALYVGHLAKKYKIFEQPLSPRLRGGMIAAALAVAAYGRENVYGVLMPNGVQPDIDYSQALVEHLQIPHCTINIHDAVQGVLQEMEKAGLTPSRQTRVNLPSRIRMATLYAVAQTVPDGIVINTSNLSEDWVGYCTIYGDSAGAFSPLGMYTTEEVIALGRVLGLPEKFLVKAPSDGLTGLTDEDNLGFTYHAVNEYVRRGVCDPAIRAQIDQKHRVSRFKFQTLPVYHNGLPMALTDETDYYR